MPASLPFSVSKRIHASRGFVGALVVAIAVNTVGAAAPLSLDEAIQRALAKNYSIKVEAFSPQIARANLLTAWGRFDPALNASYIYSEDGSPQATDPFSGARPPSSLVKTDSYDLGLVGATPWGMSYTLSAGTQNQRGTFNSFADSYFTFSGVRATQPLLRDFGFGSNMAQIRIARTERARSEWDYKEAVMNTITQVIFVYNELTFAKRTLETAKRSRELANGLVTENERRFRVGSMSEYDVTAARARVAQSAESVISAERAVQDNENFLRQLISDNRSASLLGEEIEIETPEPAPKIDVDPATDFPVALAHRPDYQRARLAIQRARFNKSLQLNQLLPRVDLVGSLGYNGLDARFGESRRAVEDRENRSYSAGVVVSVPLGFVQERGRYRSAKLTLAQAEIQLAALEQAIVVDIGNAAGQIRSTQERVAAAGLARDLAQQTLDSEIKYLRAGTSTTFVVLQLQQILAGNEISEFRALSDARKALADYDRQLGLTLERRKVVIDEQQGRASIP